MLNYHNTKIELWTVTMKFNTRNVNVKGIDGPLMGQIIIVNVKGVDGP